MKVLSVDALKEWLATIPIRDLSDGRGFCRVIMEHDFRNALENMPKKCVIDVEPVRHGHWVKSKDGYHHCSVCESKRSAIEARYCHYCGTKMDEEEIE